MTRLAGVERLVVGSILLAVGGLWTVSNLVGELDVLRTLATWWPAVLVCWGGLELYNWAAGRRSR